jgi:hypothetical protein
VIEGIASCILSLELDGSGWLATRAGCFIPGKMLSVRVE